MFFRMSWCKLTHLESDFAWLVLLQFTDNWIFKRLEIETRLWSQQCLIWSEAVLHQLSCLLLSSHNFCWHLSSLAELWCQHPAAIAEFDSVKHQRRTAAFSVSSRASFCSTAAAICTNSTRDVHCGRDLSTAGCCKATRHVAFSVKGHSSRFALSAAPSTTSRSCSKFTSSHLLYGGFCEKEISHWRCM